jgi:sugar phosphate isomerase/epimerase
MNDGLPIRIGNQTAFAAATILEPFEYAVANGFDAFEWFPDKKSSGAGWDSADLDPALRADIRATAKAKDIRLSVHANWTANPLCPEAFPVLLRDLDLAESLGATLLNIHLYTEAGIGMFANAIVPLLQRAAEGGIRISIENTPVTTPRHFNELFAALQAMDLPAAAQPGMCFDLGHANLCAGTRNNYLRYLDELAPQVPVIHLHLHENWGDGDTHLPLFTGPAAGDPCGIEGFLRRIRGRGYGGSLILEQWPQSPVLLNAARDRLLQLWRAMEEPPEGISRAVRIVKLRPLRMLK